MCPPGNDTAPPAEHLLLCATTPSADWLDRPSGAETRETGPEPTVHYPGLNLITSNRDDAQLILGSVVISGQAAVVDIALQSDPKR
jgi:hypothetical protein